jgi:hypothetical protein
VKIPERLTAEERALYEKLRAPPTGTRRARSTFFKDGMLELTISKAEKAKRHSVKLD